MSHEKYMFGDETLGIPWCAGYAIGYKIMECFKKKYPNLSVKEIVEITPHEIMEMSGNRA